MNLLGLSRSVILLRELCKVTAVLSNNVSISWWTGLTLIGEYNSLSNPNMCLLTFTSWLMAINAWDSICQLSPKGIGLRLFIYAALAYIKRDGLRRMRSRVWEGCERRSCFSLNRIFLRNGHSIRVFSLILTKINRLGNNH